jgi:uncharacterized protein YbjT (DUF2867 family)
MKVLVLGAYGLIGAAIARALVEAGHEVTGLGRSTLRAARQFPDIAWVVRDLRSMRTPADWRALLAGMDGVVNAAGVLQDGRHDDVAAVQSAAMRALFCRVHRGGVAPHRADFGRRSGKFGCYSFHAHEGRGRCRARPLAARLGDPAPRSGHRSERLWRNRHVARPSGLSTDRADRAAHSARVQCVALAEVANAAVTALDGRLLRRRQIDLVEEETHTLTELISALRRWQGLPAARFVVVPHGAARLLARAGDFLGHLGWRPPLRTTSLHEIAASVAGDPAAWREITGKPLMALPAILRAMPASAQERWFARMWLAKPLAVGGLAVFWLLSGCIGLWHFDAARRVLTERGVDPSLAGTAVGLGALIDLVLGLAVPVRQWHVPALAGMLATTLLYLGFGTFLTPDLWGDPLGPFVKALPVLVLCLVTLAIAGDR